MKGIQKSGFFFCFPEIILSAGGFRRLGVKMDKALEKLGTPLHKFPMDDTSPAPYTLVLLD
ncbi:hypothetical protein [Methanosarcina sp. 2.H.A.1B.4]|uniref:hypothetical protein n=1 Tax=Methanosarcina sp. 2.H.A.1B.4 TaxID=1483600 RepID=UPI000621A214|nr:hypothetical protein [Methanosarcina sp. 2.H.A.1B.4]KKG10211.1 hypothetical protein EO92_03395 [Methanosarcina sp. 2.H.A.1B.4]